MRVVTETIVIDDYMVIEEIRISSKNKHFRVMEERRRLQKLYDKTNRKYGLGAYFDKYKNRIVKCSIHIKRERQRCNRRFRRKMNRRCYDIVSDGGSYRKHEEYWWSII